MTPFARAQNRAGWMFVAPALALMGVFFVGPIVTGFVLSFTDFDVYAIGDLGVMRFVGLRNYASILSSPEFWNAFRVTLYFVLVGGPLTVLASLGAALLVSARVVRCRALFRTVFFLPVVTTLVAVAIVWRYFLHPQYGLLDQWLAAVGLPRIDWLGNPRWSIPAIILLSIWKSFGYNMLIFVAGLLNIPEELHEAAHLDGANAWHRFRSITLPGLAPTFLFVTIVTIIGQFQLFAEPYIMTQGGPLRSTTSIVLLLYQEGFKWWHLGYAAAMSFVLFAIMLGATLVQMRVRKGGLS
jgi:multiple sugar transport system permease protein